MLSSYCSCVIEVSPVADEAEEQLSLDVFNETWPHMRFALPEVHSYKRSLLAHAGLLARGDGEVLGSGFAAVHPGLPDPRSGCSSRCRRRRGGAGPAPRSTRRSRPGRASAESMRSRPSCATTMPESLAFAERRGFVEERREKGVSLDLTAIEPPPVEPPTGVEIVSWAERPELARGLYDVSVEASPDVPGFEHERAGAVRGLARARHARTRRLARGDLRRGSRRRGRRLREVLAHRRAADERPPRPDRGEARVARTRVAAALKAAQIGWAKANGLRAAADHQRRAQRADPPAERAARLPARDRPDLPAWAARMTETIRSERLELVPLTAEMLGGAARGTRPTAGASAASSSPDDWPDEHDRRFLRFRLRQMRDDPAGAPGSYGRSCGATRTPDGRARRLPRTARG